MPIRSELKARHDILNMEEGYEMDAAVAEQVMGWKVFDVAPHEDGTREYPHGYRTKYGLKIYDGDENYEWKPSVDIAAAWLVVEHIDARGVAWHPTVLRTFTLAGERGPWRCRIGNGVEADADTAPLAICRAALLAALTTLCPTEAQ